MSEALLSLDQIRVGARDLAEKRREAREAYEHHATEAAEAERKYRKELAISYAKHRAADKGAGESEILANGDAADLRAKRDMEQAMAKASLLRVDELERDQTTLRDLAKFSQDMETRG